MSPLQVAEFLQSKGGLARLSHDEDGKSRLACRSDRKPYGVVFHPAAQNGSSRDQFYSLTFYTHFDADLWTLEQVNEWHASRRWIRLYKIDSDLIADMDVFLGNDSLDSVLLMRNLVGWETALDELVSQLEADKD